MDMGDKKREFDGEKSEQGMPDLDFNPAQGGGPGPGKGDGAGQGPMKGGSGAKLN